MAPKLGAVEIAVPVYNEEVRIEPGIVKLHRVCTESGLTFGIVIANNGSTDRTLEIAENLKRQLPNIRIITAHQKGVGAALSTAWESSTYPIVGYMDVDLSTDLRHLLPAMSLLSAGTHQIVTGSRLLPNSTVIGRSMTREVTSRAFNYFLRSLLGVHFTDGMCGFKFLTKETYTQLSKAGLHNREWFFNTEILVVSEWIGLSVGEIPVEWRDAPGSKVRVVQLAFKYIKEIFRLRRAKAQYRIPGRRFNAA